MHGNQEPPRPESSTSQETDQETRHPSTSNNCTYDASTFPFHRFSSTTGVFFPDNNNPYNPPHFNYLRPYPYLLSDPYYSTLPSFTTTPKPFIVVSSNRGTLLCRGPNFSHYVVLPFTDPDITLTVPPLPNTPDPSLSNPTVLLILPPKLQIVFALQVSKGTYLLHVFDSSTVTWTVMPMDIINLTRNNVSGLSLIESSGIVDGRGCVYWLTNVPHYLVSFNMEMDCGSRVELHDLPKLPGWPKLALGNLLRGTRLGFLVATRYDVTLYLKKCGESGAGWERIGFFKVDGKPGIMKFENEVPLLVNGELKLWEVRDGKSSDGVDGSVEGDYSLRLHAMPPWERMPARFEDCVPFVHSVWPRPENLEVYDGGMRGCII